MSKLSTITKKVLLSVLSELLDGNSELVGFGEYGRGWNDRGESVKIKVMQTIERMEGNGKEEEKAE